MAPVVLRAIRSPAAAGFAGILVLAAILEAAIRLGWVNGQIIALPSDAIGAVPQLYEDEDIVSNFLVTLGMTGAAAALAVAVGVPLGYLLYRHRTLGEAYEGWLAAAFAAPLVLLYPLFLVIFGRTYLTLIIMGFIPGAIPRRAGRGHAAADYTGLSHRSILLNPQKNTTLTAITNRIAA